MLNHNGRWPQVPTPELSPQYILAMVDLGHTMEAIGVKLGVSQHAWRDLLNAWQMRMCDLKKAGVRFKHMSAATAMERELAVRMARLGLGPTAIARELGLSTANVVWHILKRDWPEYFARPRPRVDGAEAVRLHQECGYTQQQIADLYGVSQGCVSHKMLDYRGAHLANRNNGRRNNPPQVVQ